MPREPDEQPSLRILPFANEEVLERLRKPSAVEICRNRHIEAMCLELLGDAPRVGDRVGQPRPGAILVAIDPDDQGVAGSVKLDFTSIRRSNCFARLKRDSDASSGRDSRP